MNYKNSVPRPLIMLFKMEAYNICLGDYRSCFCKEDGTPGRICPRYLKEAMGVAKYNDSFPD